MIVTEHKGWQIESKSYRTDDDRWRPRALVSLFEGGTICTHDVRTLMSVTFDTAATADDFAVKMAKMWVDDSESRPRSTTVKKRRMENAVAWTVDHCAGWLSLLPRRIRMLLPSVEPSLGHVRAPGLVRVDRRRRR